MSGADIRTCSTSGERLRALMADGIEGEREIETVRRHFAGTLAEAHYVEVMTRRLRARLRADYPGVVR